MSEYAMFQIMVPCCYNDGKPVRTRHHREWDRQVSLVLSIQGMTIHSPSKGRWTHEGVVYRERMIPVSIIATMDEMERIAQITLKHYDQIAVLYFKISNETHIVYR